MDAGEGVYALIILHIYAGYYGGVVDAGEGVRALILLHIYAGY